jgi:hypothetical protein
MTNIQCLKTRAVVVVMIDGSFSMLNLLVEIDEPKGCEPTAA